MSALWREKRQQYNKYMYYRWEINQAEINDAFEFRVMRLESLGYERSVPLSFISYSRTNVQLMKNNHENLVSNKNIRVKFHRKEINCTSTAKGKGLFKN